MNEPISILILEDDLSLLEVLREALADLGHRVEMAYQGEQAVELCWDNEFDVLVTDIRLAGMDGLEALARMREFQPELRSLVITGFSSESDTLRALRLGVGEYLAKPFAMEALESAVERLAEQVRQQRHLQRREQGLRRYLLWSLAEKARLDAEPWVVPAAQQSADLASRLQWESEGLDCFRLASLVRSLGLQNLPEDCELLLPLEARAMLRAPGGMEGQILQAGQALARGEAVADSLPPVLKEALTGSGAAEGAAVPPRRRRTALAVALRFDESGQAAAAVQAYTRLLQAGPSQEAVLAGLQLARLAVRLQRPEQVHEYAFQALELARRQGPLSLAQAALEAGLALADFHPQAAVSVLDEAEQLHLHLDNHSSARLAAVLKSLLHQQMPPDDWLLQLSPTELASGQMWLSQRLLSYPLSEVARRFLTRLLGHSPQLAHNLAQLPLAGLALQQLQQLAASSPGPQVPPLRIFSLGVPEIYLGDERVADDAFRKNQKARFVLSYLALERGRLYPDEVLGEMFWPEDGMQGKKNLYTLRSMWRRALQPAQFPGEIEWVLRLPQGLGMTADWPWWHDVEELRGLLSRWKNLAGLDRLPLLRRAAGLYRGPFLETCYLDWAVFLRQQLESEMISALLSLADLLLEGPPGELADLQVSEACQRALEIDRCCQEAYLRWMIALNRRGRAPEALKLFQRCETILRKELGVEPSIALVQEQLRARMALS